MGNKASTRDATATEDAAVPDPDSAATSNPTVVLEDMKFSPGGGTSLSSAQQRDRSGSVTRRIVKVAKPHPEETVDTTADATPIDDDDDGNDAVFVKQQHPVPKGIAETTPEVERELDMEQAEEARNERIHTMTERQRVKREKLLQERRDKPKDTKEENNLQPNPFSRFLSVFSVEPAHPEHKRAFEGAAGDDLDEPEGKRLRPADDAQEGTTSEKNGSRDGLDATMKWHSTTAVAVAVAIVAATVATILRMKGKN